MNSELFSVMGHKAFNPPHFHMKDDYAPPPSKSTLDPSLIEMHHNTFKSNVKTFCRGKRIGNYCSK